MLMIKKEHLVSDISKLKKVYNQSFPWLVTLAEESENAKYFKDALRSLILSRLTEKESTQENVGMAVAMRGRAVYGRASSGADGHLSLAVPDRPFGK